ncbi:MAG TPA: ATP-binding cassette domain-containing protein [Gudongella oleilytica]|nr:ATP-binding cassette domain-containing protein [Gudongella oleilytica]
MIEANQLSLQYKDGTFGLKEASLVIAGGKLVYITGASGSGKTSFIKMLLGIERPTSGDLKVMNMDMKSIGHGELRSLRQKIGPVFQDFKLLDGRTACENVMTGLRFLELSKEELYQRTLESLEKVGLSHKVHNIVDKLSYGERQRVAIARAVARKPVLIIADEPTGNLDRSNSIIVLDLLKTFVSPETTVIITTHATHLLEREKDYIHITVEDGRMSLKEVHHEL